MSKNSGTAQSGPATSAGAWGLRYPGLIMAKGGKDYVKEFTSMWRLKPDTDLAALTNVLARFVQDTMALAHENRIGSEGEHFGFADSISQPPIEGVDFPSYLGDGVQEPDGTWRALKPGEFLLGYEDEAGPVNLFI